MTDLAALLTALGGLITAGAAAFALVWNTVRMSRKERPSAAERAVEQLAVAAEDNEITADELAAVLKELREGGDNA